MGNQIKNEVMILLNRIIVISEWNHTRSEKNNFNVVLEEKEEDLYKLSISVLEEDNEFKEHIYISKYKHGMEGDLKYIKTEVIYQIIEEIFTDLQHKRLELLSKIVNPVEAIEIIKNDLLLSKFNVMLDCNTNKEEELFFKLEYIEI